MKTNISFKKTMTGYVVKIKPDEEFHNETDSGLYIATTYDNQRYAKQYAEVVASPDRDKEVSVGDILIFHFNILAYTYNNKKRLNSNHFISEDDEFSYYFVPKNMTHGVIKKDGEINTLNGYCFIKPYVKQEVKSKSGIIISQKKEVDGADTDSRTEITHISNHDELKAGDVVFLPTYSNYEIKLPNITVWAVKSMLIKAKFIDDGS
jgi:co-chaperonin GroES (HSP10)